MRGHSHPRTWGTRFDPLPSSPSMSPTHNDSIPSLSKSEVMLARREDRLPHDASIFVGSLPPNVEQTELTNGLTEHLSEHDEVKSVKVIRDSKGGVCAFVQCEDASAATSLLNTLHSIPPKPFMGRMLRYEPARAFRTLLISYRTPVQTISPNEENIGDTSSGQIILDLPTAMRLRKVKSSRFVSVYYNSEAQDVRNRASLPYGYNIEDPSTVTELLFDPVVFDEETVRKLAGLFGPLETFQPYGSSEDNAAVDGKSYSGVGEKADHPMFPAPHDAPRSPMMDKGCWSVKWRHREDCISALMTLRRVPHLTVTWSHQPPSANFDQRFANQNSAPYPFHVRAQSANYGSSPVQSRSQGNNVMSMGGISRGIVPMKDFNVDFPPLTEMKEGRAQATISWSEDFPDDREDDAASRPSLSTRSSRATIGSTAESDGQDVEVSDTPELGMSPITPDTSNSLFPITPNASSGDLHYEPSRSFYSKGQIDYYGGDSTPRELDLTTVFVGGLEAETWDEQKVADFFSRFGGVLEVSIVRPVGQRSAFAFVKFDNTEASARAVREAHNTVHGGRQMRVQYRDCNPPKAAWKYPRGRGRAPVNYSAAPRHFTMPVEMPALDRQVDRVPKTDVQSTGARSANEKLPEVVQYPSLAASGKARKDSPTSTPNRTRPTQHSSPAQPSPPRHNPSEAVSQAEKYREWYDVPNSATGTPPLSSTVPGIPYPMGAGYFAPHPWMYPVPPQQVPYFGAYPRFNPSPSGQSYNSPAGSETSGPASVPSPPIWPPSNGVYGSLVPYPTAPGGQPPSDSGPPQAAVQAPLAPAGFYQNEQGGLVALYHPDQLGRYMATAQQGPSPNIQQPWAQLPQGSFCVPMPLPTAAPNVPARGAAPPVGGVNTSWAASPLPSIVPHALPNMTGYVPHQVEQTPVVHGAYIEQGPGQYDGAQQRRHTASRRGQPGSQHLNNTTHPRNGHNGRGFSRGTRGTHVGYGHPIENGQIRSHTHTPPHMMPHSHPRPDIVGHAEIKEWGHSDGC